MFDFKLKCILFLFAGNNKEWENWNSWIRKRNSSKPWKVTKHKSFYFSIKTMFKETGNIHNKFQTRKLGMVLEKKMNQKYNANEIFWKVELKKSIIKNLENNSNTKDNNWTSNLNFHTKIQ